MTKRIAMVLVGLLGGCASGSDPRARVTCDSTWPTPAGGMSCDSACKAPKTGTGFSCETGINSGGNVPQPIACDATFDVDGETGCCYAVGTDTPATFKPGSGQGENRTRSVFFLSCESDAKAADSCDRSWGLDTSGPTQPSCDVACAHQHTGNGPACDTNVTQGGQVVSCASTFDYFGETGCCVNDMGSFTLTAVGEPTRTRAVFFLSCK